MFDALFDGRRTAVKLTDSRFADRSVVASRQIAIESLANRHPNVVPPIRFDGALVQPIGSWLMTATPFIEGEQLDESAAGDAELLGRSLALLHEPLRQLDAFEIPPIAALVSTGRAAERSCWQLLHGDFSCQNVIVEPTMLRVFDFDDCGYGPIEYDIANSIYMVLFDSDVTNQPDLYETFRPALLEGYANGSGRRINEVAVDEMIGIRIEALGRWLDDLSGAPIGIRSSSLEWLETLAAFVRRHDPESRQ